MNSYDYLDDKENISGNMLFPHEKLGSVPEDRTTNTMSHSQKKFSELEDQMYLDEGEKRIAIIDPLKSLNKGSLIANKLLVSPLKLISGKKRSYTDSDTNLNKKKTKPVQPVQVSSNLDEALRVKFFTGKASVTMSKIDKEKEFELFVQTIKQVEGVDESQVFDSCYEVVNKINNFLHTSGIDRNLFCECLNITVNSFNAFIQKSVSQEKCENPTYKNAYVFFEKLRIYMNEPKSGNRCLNEGNHPNGFALEKEMKRMNKSGSKCTIKNLKGTKFCVSTHELC